MTTWQEFIIGAFFPLFVGALAMVWYGLGLKCPRWIAGIMARRAARRAAELELALSLHRHVCRRLANRGEHPYADALWRALASEAVWLERFML